MKKLATLIIAIFTFLSINAQNEITNAFSKSYEYESKSDYSNAILTLEKVYNETSYSLNLRLGWLHYSNGDYLKSQKYYKKAITLEPKSIEAMLGYIYPTSVLENWDDVLKTYKEILTIAPNNTVVNYSVGNIYFLRKNWVNAEKHLITVLELYPFDYDTNLLISKVYIAQGKIKEAKLFCERALEYNPSSIEALELMKAL